MPDNTAVVEKILASSPTGEIFKNGKAHTAATPFTDFFGLMEHLPAYREQALRALVKRGVIPVVRLPGSRKFLFHLPTVTDALLRYQRGGSN